MNERNYDAIKLENCKIKFRNFKGTGSMYNKEGDRNFSVILDEDIAAQLKEMGYNIKYNEDREEYRMQIKVGYKRKAPMVYVVTKKKRTLLTEETIGNLDYAEIKNVDLAFTPSYWQMPNGNSGVTAYLDTMYVTVAEDPFMDKYSDYDVEGEEIPFD